MKILLTALLVSLSILAQDPRQVTGHAISVKSVQPGPRLVVQDFLNEEIAVEKLREDLEDHEILNDLDKLALLKRRISAFNQSRRTTTLLRHYRCQIWGLPLDVFVGGIQQGGRALIFNIKIR